ncbi:MAG: 1-phosphofructokinase [Chloroflexota bacterium]
MKIATVTLNPAIDQTVSVDDFRIGAVNRSRAMRFDAGGKGVNVASFLADYGMDVVVTGFLGEENADIFERHFTRKKIDDCFIRVPGETRVNIKITDEHNQETTDLNMPGQAAGEEAVDRLCEQIETLAEACDFFVLSGNLRPGLSSDFYAKLIKSLKEKNRSCILDTSGEALAEGVKAGPRMIKPNIAELGQLVRRELNGLNDVHAAALSLINDGVELVVVSMGAEGALLVSRDNAFLASPPSVIVKSTVGAGDAMVAGLVAGFADNLSMEECARLATAFSVSAITRLGRDLHGVDEIKSYQAQILITPFVVQQS